MVFSQEKARQLAQKAKKKLRHPRGEILKLSYYLAFLGERKAPGEHVRRQWRSIRQQQKNTRAIHFWLLNITF